MILFKEEPIDSLYAINTPSYVQQNVYGNLRYYPVVEPTDFISIEDITEEHKKNAMKYSSVEEVVEAFFKYHPEENSGKLTDSKEVYFLGFKYIYHPHHKTYYGNVSKSYLLLPIVARWYMAVNKDASDNDFTSAQRFPRGFNGGESAPFKYEIITTSSSSNTPLNTSSFFIPMLAKDSPWRSIYLMSKSVEDVYDILDELLKKHGFDPSKDLFGTSDTDIVLTARNNEKTEFFVFTNSINLEEESSECAKVDMIKSVAMYRVCGLSESGVHHIIANKFSKYL